MNDLERLFRHLVATVAATDPTRLSCPIPIADIQYELLPYRTHRRALQIESSEDYEVLLLRLCAGEGGFARTEAPEIRARLQLELQGSNPDLELLSQHGDALLVLSAAAVRRALEFSPNDDYAPPARPVSPTHGIGMPTPVVDAPVEHLPQPVDPGLEAEPASELELPGVAEPLPLDVVRGTVQPAPAPASAKSAARAAAASAAAMCLYCGDTLPAGREVKFCPYCGQAQTTVRCPECQSEVELGWRHCITCGAAVGER